MKLAIGNRVEVLDENTQGTVIAIQGNTVTVMTLDGFTMDFEESQLVVMHADLHISKQDVAQALKEKEQPKKRKTPIPSAKERNAPKMEVDLHIHQLTTTTKGMSNFDMLNLQLDAAKRQLEFAIQKRIPKVVFIHGVGAGVLKTELHYLFGRYENVKYYDAEYQKYGLGATEVYIFQNPKT